MPTPTFATLRSRLDPGDVDRAARDHASDEVISLLVEHALGEVLATLDDLLSIGLTPSEIETALDAAVESLDLDDSEPLSMADRLRAIRFVAARIERRGLLAGGSRWRDRVGRDDLLGDAVLFV